MTRENKGALDLLSPGNREVSTLVIFLNNGYGSGGMPPLPGVSIGQRLHATGQGVLTLGQGVLTFRKIKATCMLTEARPC